MGLPISPGDALTLLKLGVQGYRFVVKVHERLDNSPREVFETRATLNYLKTRIESFNTPLGLGNDNVPEAVLQVVWGRDAWNDLKDMFAGLFDDIRTLNRLLEPFCNIQQDILTYTGRDVVEEMYQIEDNKRKLKKRRMPTAVKQAWTQMVKSKKDLGEQRILELHAKWEQTSDLMGFWNRVTHDHRDITAQVNKLKGNIDEFSNRASTYWALQEHGCAFRDLDYSGYLKIAAEEECKPIRKIASRQCTSVARLCRDLQDIQNVIHMELRLVDEEQINGFIIPLRAWHDQTGTSILDIKPLLVPCNGAARHGDNLVELVDWLKDNPDSEACLKLNESSRPLPLHFSLKLTHVEPKVDIGTVAAEIKKLAWKTKLELAFRVVESSLLLLGTQWLLALTGESLSIWSSIGGEPEFLLTMQTVVPGRLLSPSESPGHRLDKELFNIGILLAELSFQATVDKVEWSRPRSEYLIEIGGMILTITDLEEQIGRRGLGWTYASAVASCLKECLSTQLYSRPHEHGFVIKPEQQEPLISTLFETLVKYDAY